MGMGVFKIINSKPLVREALINQKSFYGGIKLAGPPTRRARFWLLPGRALVLPQLPTSRDQFPLCHKTYKHVLVKFFALN